MSLVDEFLAGSAPAGAPKLGPARPARPRPAPSPGGGLVDEFLAQAPQAPARKPRRFPRPLVPVEAGIFNALRQGLQPVGELVQDYREAEQRFRPQGPGQDLMQAIDPLRAVRDAPSSPLLDGRQLARRQQVLREQGMLPGQERPISAAEAARQGRDLLRPQGEKGAERAGLTRDRYEGWNPSMVPQDPLQALDTTTRAAERLVVPFLQALFTPEEGSGAFPLADKESLKGLLAPEGMGPNTLRGFLGVAPVDPRAEGGRLDAPQDATSRVNREMLAMGIDAAIDPLMWLEAGPGIINRGASTVRRGAQALREVGALGDDLGEAFARGVNEGAGGAPPAPSLFARGLEGVEAPTAPMARPEFSLRALDEALKSPFRSIPRRQRAPAPTPPRPSPPEPPPAATPRTEAPGVETPRGDLVDEFLESSLSFEPDTPTQVQAPAGRRVEFDSGRVRQPRQPPELPTGERMEAPPAQRAPAPVPEQQVQGGEGLVEEFLRSQAPEPPQAHPEPPTMPQVGPPPPRPSVPPQAAKSSAPVVEPIWHGPAPTEPIRLPGGRRHRLTQQERQRWPWLTPEQRKASVTGSPTAREAFQRAPEPPARVEPSRPPEPAPAQPAPGRPRLESLDPSTIQVDARTYQFKGAGDAQGVTGRLRDVQEWNPVYSGKAVVHERLDGTRYIADGHQRLELAKRAQAAGQDVSLDAVVLREADGYTAQNVRKIAALKNLAENSGTSVDAAKVIREDINDPDIAKLPRSSAVVRDGMELAKLGDGAFEEVVNGRVRPDMAAHVGRMIEDPAEQLAALKTLRRLNPKTAAEAESIVQDLRVSGFARRNEGLPEVQLEDLLSERAQVMAATADRIKRDKTLFRQLVEGEGRATAAGNVLRGVVDDFIEAVRQNAGRADADRPRPGRPARGSEPGHAPRTGDDASPGSPRAGLDFEPEGAPPRSPSTPPPEPPRKQAESAPKPGMDVHGYTVDGRKVELGAQDKVKPVALPALVRLVRDLTGSAPKVSNALVELGKRLRGTVRGRVTGRAVELNPAIFADSETASRVLGHEIGHLPDWMPGTGSASAGTVAENLTALRRRMRAWFREMPTDVRQELLQLSQWWRPFDQATADRKFLAYRADPEELFADAVSVLFNDVDELKARAPKFWARFQQQLDADPNLKQAVADVWTWRSGTFSDLASDLRQTFRADLQGDAFWRALQAAEQQRASSMFERLRQQFRALGDNWRSFRDRAQEVVADRAVRVKRRATELERAGAEIPEDIDPRVTWDEFNFATPRVALITHDWQRQVVEPLRAAGVDEVDLGEFMLHASIVDGEAAKMANPHGITREYSQDILRQMREQLGAEKWAKLEETARAAREIRWRGIEDAFDAGLIDPETYQRLRASRDTFAPLLTADELQRKSPALIKAQVGTLDQVENPATASLMQAVELSTWAHENRARRRILEFHERFDPDLVSGGARQGLESFSVMEGGKARTVYVDPYVAELFSKRPTADLSFLTGVASALDGAFKWFWLTANPFFQLAQLPKDFARSLRNLSAVRSLNALNPANAVQLMGYYLEALPHAFRYGFGDAMEDRFLREAIEDYALLPPTDTIAATIARDSEGAAQLARYGYVSGLDARKKLGPVQRAVRSFLDFLVDANNAAEALPKVAAYKRLRAQGASQARRGNIVRTFVGTPNYKIRGAATEVTNRIFTFSNIILQGLRADLALAAAPKTRTGFILQATAQSVAPKMLMAGAAIGLLGPELQELYRAIPERDKRDKLVIPVGWEEGGEYGKRVRYLAVPQDDTNKHIGALLWNTLSRTDRPVREWLGRALQENVRYAGEQVPGVSPTLEQVSTWSTFLSGENPEGAFGPALTEKEQAAGGLHRWKGMLRFQLGQFGQAGKLVRAYAFRDDAPAPVVSWTPAQVPNPFFKVSDYGLREREREAQNLEKSAKARNRLKYGPKAQNLYSAYYRLQKSPRETRQQKEAYYTAQVAMDLYRATDEQAWMLEQRGQLRQAQVLRDRLELQLSTLDARVNRALGKDWR